MMEWVLLVLLVPAIVVPVVLLFGFAGCDWVFKLEGPDPFQGTLSATVDSRSAITLRWGYTGLNDASFEVKRKRSLDATFEVVTPPDFEASEFTDTGLDEGTSYDYQLISIETGSGNKSAPAEITAVTLAQVFVAVLTGEAAGPNRCVVQRIEPSRLVRSGTRVQLTLARSAGGPLLINRLSISHAAASGDPYDSDGSLAVLVDIAAPLFLPADPAAGILELPAFDFALDQTRPLLVAFDVGPQGQVRLLLGVSTAEATSFASPGGVQEATVADRSPGYAAVGSIVLVQRIDAI